jgi:hypothetical protein
LELSTKLPLILASPLGEIGSTVDSFVGTHIHICLIPIVRALFGHLNRLRECSIGVQRQLRATVAAGRTDTPRQPCRQQRCDAMPFTRRRRDPPTSMRDQVRS